MNGYEYSRRTTVNVQEKANLIWAIADKLVGVYKPHENFHTGQGKSEHVFHCSMNMY